MTARDPAMAIQLFEIKAKFAFNNCGGRVNSSALSQGCSSLKVNPNFMFRAPGCRRLSSPKLRYIGQMICFCADEFHWRRIWQNPGEFLLSGPAEMAFRALLYRRPTEPRTLAVKIGSSTYTIQLRRHRRARRYTLRIHPSRREAILTMPPRGNLYEAKDFAQRHGAWIAAQPGLPKAAPFSHGTSVPLRGVPHRSCIARACVDRLDGNARKR
jgi:hypothetical protein